MNHIDVSDPVFILQIIKLQKTPRKLIYVATTEYHKYPLVKKLLEEDECIFVNIAELPKDITETQARMTDSELKNSSLSDVQVKQIKNYQQQKQQYGEQVINDMVDRLKSGYNVFIFPTGTFDHYNHKPDMIRAIKPGAARAIIKCITDKVDAEVLILKKLGVPIKYAGSFFASLPYMVLGGSKKVKLSLEAAIPIEFFNHELIKNSENPIKIITALYASYLSTEYLESPCKQQKLKINPLVLNQEEQKILVKLRDILKSKGFSEDSVKDPLIPSDSMEFGYSPDIEHNPFLTLDNQRITSIHSNNITTKVIKEFME